ncbi:hypothetical protein [Dactylosporangium sp. NPDC051484]|uniref:hypothetical protein n=1 Tax=Dactylosporangium sp. NPDC051484 TaxID=3154942 RepID=UPI003450745C
MAARRIRPAIDPPGPSRDGPRAHRDEPAVAQRPAQPAAPGSAELAVVPRASHTLLIEKPQLCTSLVATFLGGPPAPTHMPIRRA